MKIQTILLVGALSVAGIQHAFALRDQTITSGVLIGMSAPEVVATIGPPSMRARHGPGGGATWSYPVPGAIPGTRMFYVEFSPDEHVVGVQEYSPPAGG